MADVSVWTEKYRPKTLSDVVNQKYVIDRLKAFVKEKNIPHMLFAGPAGCGKTTAALAIARELYGDSLRGNMLMLNASDERGIDVIRGEVKRFASTISVSDVPFKLIFLDESDALTPEAQQALRRTMEMFSNKTRFILAANYSSRIIEPIQSRCAVFRFSSLKDLDVMEYLDRIIDGEKLKIEDKAKLTVAKLSEGDLRKATNILQASAVLGKKITEDLVYEVAAQADPKEIRKMVEHALAGKFVEARDLLKEILLKRGVSGEDIIKQVSNQIYEMEIPERSKAELIEKVGEYEFRMQSGNEQIQIEAMLAQFALHRKA
jgi:replication factor C small subunit